MAKGETHHLPIALASIMSKYIRELFMLFFNRYWANQVTDLRPTAGYYQDGKRFLLRSESRGVCGKVFQAAGVAMPPAVKQLPGRPNE